MNSGFRTKALEQAKADETSNEARILRAAQKLFARKGYKGTTTREIAESAGVNIATLHYYWGSKEELWNASHYDLYSESQEFMQNMFAELRDMEPREAFRTAIYRMYSTLIDNPEITMLRERARGHPIEEKWEQDDEQNFNILVAYFDHMTDYRFDPVETRFALACFFGAMGYFLLPAPIRRTFGEDPENVSEEFKQKVTETIATMLDRFGGVECAPDGNAK